MIYIRVCNSACLALFDLESLGACLLNLGRRTFRCSEKNTEQIIIDYTCLCLSMCVEKILLTYVFVVCTKFKPNPNQ